MKDQEIQILYLMRNVSIKKLVFLDILNKHRKDSIDTNRINMVKARTDFKMTVRKFKYELEKAKT